MSTEEFVLKFDGPALGEHEMDVEALAGSLLALSGAIKRAQQIADPKSDPVSLHIKATEAGSFEVDLAMVLPSMASYVMDMLTGRDATAVVNAGAILTLTVNAWGWVKRLRGRKVTASETSVDGATKLTLEDGTVVTIPETVARVASDIEFRKRTEKMVEPLGRDGVDGISLRRVVEEEVLITIGKRDAPYFETPALPDVEAVVNTEEVLLSPLSISFDWRQWRVNDGASSFGVAVADEAFRERVDQGMVRIGRDDLFKVRMRTEQTPKQGGGIKISRIVERVLEHRRGGQQDELDFGDDAES